MHVLCFCSTCCLINKIINEDYIYYCQIIPCASDPTDRYTSACSLVIIINNNINNVDEWVSLSSVRILRPIMYIDRRRRLACMH